MYKCNDQVLILSKNVKRKLYHVENSKTRGQTE